MGNDDEDFEGLASNMLGDRDVDDDGVKNFEDCRPTMEGKQDLKGALSSLGSKIKSGASKVKSKVEGPSRQEKMEELEELQNADHLTDEEEERLQAIQGEIEDADVNIFDVLSYETYKGLKAAAKYGVEPDETDVQQALANNPNEIQDRYGGMTNDDARQYIQDEHIDYLIEKSTNFASFAIGIEVLGKTLGDTKN